MPINEALLAAMKAAGYIKPNARKIMQYTIIDLFVDVLSEIYPLLH